MTPDLDETLAHQTLDDTTDDPTRRIFVQHLTFMGGGVVLLGSACNKPPKPDAEVAVATPAPRTQALTTSHLTFTNEDFAIVSAAAERVIPKDEDAGALDANVPEYIDRILQTRQLENMKNNFVPGVAALDRRCQRMFKVGFAAAKPEQQDEVLTIFKNSPEGTGEARWFEMLVVLSLEGFLGDSSYGGNRDGVGWKALGFTLVDHTKGDPTQGYNGSKHLETLRCGGGKGC
jgi:gluconate 2-dehydrogenase gamma chain